MNNSERESWSHVAHLVDIIQHLRHREDLYDVVLIAGVDNKRIPAHRLIMIGSSKYLSDAFSRGTDHSEKNEITLPGINGDALEEIVNFCYTGRLEFSMKTIRNLIETADFLQITKIFSACGGFIEKHLKPSNCLGWASFAEQHNLKKLQESANNMIKEEFLEVSGEQEFLKLSITELAEILEMKLDCPGEKVYCAAIKWVNYDFKDREKYLEAEILERIDLSEIDAGFIYETIRPICTTSRSKDLLLDGLMNHFEFST